MQAVWLLFIAHAIKTAGSPQALSETRPTGLPRASSLPMELGAASDHTLIWMKNAEWQKRRFHRTLSIPQDPTAIRGTMTALDRAAARAVPDDARRRRVASIARHRRIERLQVPGGTLFNHADKLQIEHERALGAVQTARDRMRLRLDEKSRRLARLESSRTPEPPTRSLHREARALVDGHIEEQRREQREMEARWTDLKGKEQRHRALVGALKDAAPAPKRIKRARMTLQEYQWRETQAKLQRETLAHEDSQKKRRLNEASSDTRERSEPNRTQRTPIVSWQGHDAASSGPPEWLIAGNRRGSLTPPPFQIARSPSPAGIEQTAIPSRSAFRASQHSGTPSPGLDNSLSTGRIQQGTMATPHSASWTRTEQTSPFLEATDTQSLQGSRRDRNQRDESPEDRGPASNPSDSAWAS